MKDFYTVREVAEMCNITDAAIRNYIARGQLKATKLDGRTNIIYAKDLKAWQSTRKPKPKRGNK